MRSASLTVTRWLAEQGFPVTAPHPAVRQPIAVQRGGVRATVSFWTYYPRPDQAGVPGAELLGRLLRGLHRLPQPPFQLPPYRPLGALTAALDTSRTQAALPTADRQWLIDRIRQLRMSHEQLRSVLGTGLVHNDAHPENLLWHTAAGPDAVVLGDWDSVTTGPRELDLIAVDLEPRFGAPDQIREQFAAEYGHDVRNLPAYPTLRDIYSLRTLTALVRLAPDNPAAARELHHRVTSLRSGTAELWNPW